ncbi:hypothetical protein [Catenuloplanes japonicus]|uniref:hypothetical protein n=1 Tax=Catenuloplanes japonicus TaxID=33876 RepID=UPI000527C950|nr:hypothetical protein [Catenuloplanes japonicus]
MTKDHKDRDDRRIWSKIDMVKLSAGTLAAVSSAVCASWLGVTGTIVGAALASVVATIGQELYAHSLTHAHKRLQGVRLEQALAAVGATGRPPLWAASSRAGPSRAAPSQGAPSRGAPSRGGDETVPRDDASAAGGAAAMASAGLGFPDTDSRSRDAADVRSRDAAGDSGARDAVPGFRSHDPAPDPDAADDAGGAFAVVDRRAASRALSGDTASGGAGSSGAASDRTARNGTASDGAASDRTDGDVATAAGGRFADRADDDEPVIGRRAHWMRLGLATVAMFVLAMLAITAFELIAGDSLAGLFGDGSAGATTVPFLSGDGDPDPAFTPAPPVETLPADPATTAPAGTPEPTAPAGTPAATDPVPTTGTDPQPDLDPTGDPATPPGDAEAPAADAPAAGEGPIG